MGLLLMAGIEVFLNVRRGRWSSLICGVDCGKGSQSLRPICCPQALCLGRHQQGLGDRPQTAVSVESCGEESARRPGRG